MNAINIIVLVDEIGKASSGSLEKSAPVKAGKGKH